MMLFFTFLLVFGSIFLQLLAGAYGFFLPVTAMAVFYLTAVYGWQTGSGVALLAGIVIDSVYFRPLALSPLALTLTVPLTLLWLERYDNKNMLAKVMGGMTIALMIILPAVIHNIYRSGRTPDDILQEIMGGMFTVAAGGGILPLIIMLCDELAEPLGLPKFVRARDKITGRRR